MGQLYVLSPERADQCVGLVEPNTCYAVTDIRKYRDTGAAFFDFIIPEFPSICVENLTKPNHLERGGRWLLLEQLP